MGESATMSKNSNPHPPESRAAKMVREVFESGRPITYVRSSEEQRVGRVLHEVARGMGDSVPVWTWSLTESPQTGTETPRGALDHIIAAKGPAIFHLKDFHEPLRDSPEIRRRLRDVYASCIDRKKFVVISSPVRFMPEEVERNVMFLELRPPDQIELVEFLREERASTDEQVLRQVAVALQ